MKQSGYSGALASFLSVNSKPWASLSAGDRAFCLSRALPKSPPPRWHPRPGRTPGGSPTGIPPPSCRPGTGVGSVGMRRAPLSLRPCRAAVRDPERRRGAGRAPRPLRRRGQGRVGTGASCFGQRRWQARGRLCLERRRWRPWRIPRPPRPAQRGAGAATRRR